MFGYGGMFGSYGEYGGYDEGLNRGDWAEKSQKALEREAFAKASFDLFLKRCEALTTFPVTEVIVQPSNHLTDASTMHAGRTSRSMSSQKAVPRNDAKCHFQE
jgi:hypothetical protein